MNYISKIFERADIQNICEFLLYGVECIEINDKPYKQRLDESSTVATDIIKNKIPDTNDFEEIMTGVYAYTGEVEKVYMEIGLQCGVALATQALKNK